MLPLPYLLHFKFLNVNWRSFWKWIGKLNEINISVFSIITLWKEFFLFIYLKDFIFFSFFFLDTKLNKKKVVKGLIEIQFYNLYSSEAHNYVSIFKAYILLKCKYQKKIYLRKKNLRFCGKNRHFIVFIRELHLGVSSFSILLSSCGCNAPSCFFYYLPRIQMTVLSKFDDDTICIYSFSTPHVALFVGILLLKMSCKVIFLSMF